MNLPIMKIRGDEPTRAECEQLMLKIAQDEAEDGETTEESFVRLCKARDPRIETLYVAARQADRDVDQTLQKRQDVSQRMQELARAQRRDGETEQQAYMRLLKNDDTMRQLYESR
jgi:hypothetical protein